MKKIVNRHKKRIHVVAAVIEQNQQILIAKRPIHVHQGGLWEFPGGKVETAEPIQEALKRELFEELDIHLTAAQPLIKLDHNYSDKLIHLDVWRVTAFNGTARGKEGQEIRWVSSNQLSEFKFPTANKAIITATQLPQKYLITPDPFDDDEHQFLTRLERAFKSGITLAQLRSKKLDINKLSSLYEKANTIAEQYNATIMLNCSVEEAINIEVTHVHLSSNNLMNIASVPNKLFTSASCHNKNEIARACALGINFIVIAPVKKTQTHPDTHPIGWEKFTSLSEISTIPVFALGGMTINDIPVAVKNGAQGVAAISALW